MTHRARSAPADGGAATVVLDIGDDVGALVVELTGAPTYVDSELHAEPVGNPSARFHTGIHERVVGEVATAVAIFPSVVAGRYDLLDRTGAWLGHAEVAGGGVTTVRLGLGQSQR